MSHCLFDVTLYGSKEEFRLTDKEYQAKLRSQRRNDSKRKKKKKEEDSVFRYHSRSKHRVGTDHRHMERVDNLMSKMFASPNATQLMWEAIDDYYDECLEKKPFADEFIDNSIKMPEIKEYVDFFPNIEKEFTFIYTRLREAAVKYGADAFLLREFENTMFEFMEEVNYEHIDGMLYFLRYLETELYDMVNQLFYRRLREFKSPWLKIPTALFRYDDYVFREY